MSWTSAADSTGTLSRRTLSPIEQDMVADTLDAAVEWKEGRMSYQDAARVAGEPDQHIRFLALTSTPRDDPRWQALRALIDVLIRASGFVVATQGIYTPQELGQHQAAVHSAQQERRSA